MSRCRSLATQLHRLIGDIVISGTGHLLCAFGWLEISMANGLQVETDGSSDSQLWVLAKGAPEVIQQYLGQTPDGYENTYREFAAQGGR